MSRIEKVPSMKPSIPCLVSPLLNALPVLTLSECFLLQEPVEFRCGSWQLQEWGSELLASEENIVSMDKGVRVHSYAASRGHMLYPRADDYKISP